MKTRLFLPIAAVLAILIIQPDSAFGRRMAKPRPTPARPKVNASGTTIVSASAASVTIQYSKEKQTYRISGETMIEVDGRRVRSLDLKPGMHAELGISKIEPDLLLSISASTK
jgi:hypothetical protein